MLTHSAPVGVNPIGMEGSILRWLQEMTFEQPIERCRWFKAGAESVTWLWDDKALLHRPIFSAPSA